MSSEWAKNSTFQITFTVINLGSAMFDQIDVESSIWLEGQEYIVKNCVENFDTETKEITAWHVYNEINRIYKRADLSKQDTSSDTSNNDTSSDGSTNTDSSDNSDQEKTYSVEDVLKAWLDDNKLGFSYEVHGKFDKQVVDVDGGGSGKDMLSKICEAWPDAVIYPDNKKIRVYSEDEFFKDKGRILDFPHDAKSVKITRDSKGIINQIRCVGGKHSVASSDGGAGGPGSLDSVIDFCKSPINASFGVNKQAMIQNFAARSRRAQAWGVDVNRLYDVVEQNGVSPAWFFAYELQEDLSGGLGWLNHTYRHGDAYSDAAYVCSWIKQTSQTPTIRAATESGKGNQSLAAQWNQEFPKGTIGHVYLQGTAAAAWELEGIPGGYFGKPLAGCVSVIKSWGGHTVKTDENHSGNSGGATGGGWGWPFPCGEGHFALGQTFGTHPGDGVGRPNGFHDGTDFGSYDHPGAEIHAIHGGKCIISGDYVGGVGYYVVIQDETGLNVEYQEAFSSPSLIRVHVGDVVKLGDVIGTRNTSHVHIGITRHSFPEAFAHAWSNDGTWIDPVATIKSGGASVPGGSGSGGGGGTTEEYYFQPFIVQDDKSIAEWGIHPGPDLVDERFHDAESMRKYALTKLKPNPDLTIEVSLNGNEFVPQAGEILKVLAKKDYSGSYKTVGFKYYSEDKSKDTEITLNNSKTTILDYQNQRTKQIKQALDEQKKRIQGLADSLDKQSKALTQITNDKNESDKNLEAVDKNVYWMQNGQSNLVSGLTGGTASSESYSGSSATELTSGTLKSNMFSVKGAQGISACAMAKLTKTDDSCIASMYVQFYKDDGTVAGKSNSTYITGAYWLSSGAADIYVPSGASRAQLVFTISGAGTLYIARPQVNKGYKVTPWSSLK